MNRFTALTILTAVTLACAAAVNVAGRPTWAWDLSVAFSLIAWASFGPTWRNR